MRRQLLVSLCLLPMLVQCRGSGVGATARDGSELDPAECRSYAAAASVRWGASGGELACRFDTASLEHVCDLSSGAMRVTMAADYASVADFVEAGRHIGKVTSLSERLRENGSVRSSTQHRYDELGRLVYSIGDEGGRTVRHAYSDYDAAGRPRRAIATRGSGDGCDRELVSIAYDDEGGRVSRRYRALDPARCGFAERALLERYDARGNRVSVEEASGSGVATRFAASPGGTRQVCL